MNEMGVNLTKSIDDRTIIQIVRENLARDVRISHPNHIEVEATNGVVTLSGTVETYYQKVDAADDAWTSPGVVDVENGLVVLPSFIPTDNQIAADVQSLLNLDDAIDATNINVTVVDRTVYLRGTVTDYFQRQRAADDARSVSGVTEVVNELTILSG